MDDAQRRRAVNRIVQRVQETYLLRPVAEVQAALDEAFREDQVPVRHTDVARMAELISTGQRVPPL